MATDMSKEAMKLALEALEKLMRFESDSWELGSCRVAGQAIKALREALANEALDKMAENARELGLDYETAQHEPVRVPVTDSTYNYAKSLAEAIFKQHFASDEHYSSGRIVWGVNDTVIGILTQIDNMVADMVRKPAQQQEPVAWRVWRGDAYELFFSKYAADRRADCFTKRPDVEPLYTSPQAQRTWVGLTEPERLACYDLNPARFASAIEAKLKEKNT